MQPKDDTRHPYNRIKMEPYKSKYFNVSPKPVKELSDEFMMVIRKIEELLDLVERQRKLWLQSSSVVTLNAINLVQSTLLAFAQALKADDYVFERCVAAIYGKSMADFVLAIRCPTTNDQTVIDGVKQDRQILKNGTSLSLSLSRSVPMSREHKN